MCRPAEVPGGQVLLCIICPFHTERWLSPVKSDNQAFHLRKENQVNRLKKTQEGTVEQSVDQDSRGSSSGRSTVRPWNDSEIRIFLLEWEVTEQEVGHPGQKLKKKVRVIRKRLYERGLRKSWEDCFQLLSDLMTLYYRLCNDRARGIEPLFSPYSEDLYRILGHRQEWSSQFSGPVYDAAGNHPLPTYSGPVYDGAWNHPLPTYSGPVSYGAGNPQIPMSSGPVSYGAWNPPRPMSSGPVSYGAWNPPRPMSSGPVYYGAGNPQLPMSSEPAYNGSGNPQLPMSSGPVYYGSGNPQLPMSSGPVYYGSGNPQLPLSSGPAYYGSGNTQLPLSSVPVYEGAGNTPRPMYSGYDHDGAGSPQLPIYPQPPMVLPTPVRQPSGNGSPVPVGELQGNPLPTMSSGDSVTP
ncbi:hypothetical protein STEG23_032603 [Scotinomys teguina]